VAEAASISAGIAGRYASAIFDLAREDGALGRLGTDIDALEGALAVSAELREVIASPLHSRDEMAATMAALGGALGLSTTTANALALMAQRRRLFVLPQMLRALRARIAEELGQITAEVTAAKALTKAQTEKLAKALSARTGKDVQVNVVVDEALIGGLVVKLGSKMIDTSIRSRLAALQNAMKEVG